MSEPRYSGPNRSGTCVCGCPWDDHHLGVVMNSDYAKDTGEAYLPEECEAFGWNELGGMKLVDGKWQNHCQHYVDSYDCKRIYAGVSDDLKPPALAMLHTELNSVLPAIKNAYRANPKEWAVDYHFGWGMAVRNLLREKGFGEDYFKIHNLDDIYVQLVEEALELARN